MWEVGQLVVTRSPFCAIKLLPLAGRPTMTTQMRVSSTCTPTPLVFLECDVARLRAAGRMKSPWGARLSSGLYCSGWILGPLGTPCPGGSRAEGMVVGWQALGVSWVEMPRLVADGR